MQIKPVWVSLTTISLVQIKSYYCLRLALTPFDDVLPFLHNRAEGKAIKLFAKEMFITEPFKGRGVTVILAIKL